MEDMNNNNKPTLNYDDVILNSKSKKDNKTIRNDKNIARRKLISSYVINNGYTELYSDYFGMDSYYYDKAHKKMYVVCNICDDFSSDISPTFEISTDEHILNHIKNKHIIHSLKHIKLH
jgi:hypothetical protein